jgi:hypothetical protein
MKTLNLKESNINETVKQINRFRLMNKNGWYLINIEPNNKDIFHTYRLKCFDTWIQIFIKYDNKDNILYKDSFYMDAKVKDFKEYLYGNIV